MVSCAERGCGRVVAICCCGVAVRMALGIVGLQPTLEGAMELVVSSTSWQRAQEGLFLGTMGLSHYAGSVFTGSPLMLAAAAICAMLPVGAQALAATALFTAFDVMSALLLRAICVRAVAAESQDWETQLEEWMDEDAKPPGRREPSALNVPPAPTTPMASETATVAATSDAETAGRDANGNATPLGKPSSGSMAESVASNLPDVVLAAYLLNPVLAGQCAALSGDVLGRVLPLVALAAAGARRPGLTAAALAAAACLWRFYATALLLPLALVLGQGTPRDSGETSALVASCGVDQTEESGADGVCAGDGARAGSSRVKGNGAGRRRGTKGGQHRRSQDSNVRDGAGGGKEIKHGGVADGVPETDRAATAGFDPRYFEFDANAFLRLCAAFVGWCVVVLGACWLGTSGSWAFLSAAARGQLLCENLTPNAGLYWYFFAELFPRFRGFFRVLFLSQPYVYVLPATLRLGMFPEALAVLLLAIFGLFQPYPTLADPMLAGCLFLCHPRTSARMRIVIPVCMVAFVPSFLLPTMRHLWLQAGTGNANFYYFQTVVLNVLLSVFVLQFVAALVKRRKALTVAFKKRRKSSAVATLASGVWGSGADGAVGEGEGDS